MSLNKLLITCAGTGGHFYPGLSIARQFKKDGGSVKLILSGVHAIRQAEIAAGYGIDAEVLPFMPSPWKAPFKFMRGLFGGWRRTRRVLREFKPDALLGMGSFTMAPVLIPALFKRIPLALHDGNARIGKANRIFSSFARVMGTAFPPVNAEQCHCPLVETGMPVRPELLEKCNISRENALTELSKISGRELDPDLPLILIFGGSQGAAIFNETLPLALKKLSRKMQVIHLTGKNKLNSCADFYKDADFPYFLLESHENMEFFLGAADLVFCRSGGSSVAELNLFGKAAVLVPFPFAVEDHQSDNARYPVNNGAGIMISNREFTESKALEILNDFFDDRAKWETYAANALKLARPEAASAMLKEISAAVN